MRSAIVLFSLCGGLLAADPVLGPPVRVEIALDGARLAFPVELPAGGGDVVLPRGAGLPVRIEGAEAWHLHEGTGRRSAPPLPEPASPLLAELTDLQLRLASHADRLAAADAAATAMLGHVAAAGAQPAAWQEPLDALLAERERLHGEAPILASAYAALHARATAIASEAIDLASVLALPVPGQEADLAAPPTLAELGRRWEAAAESTGERRVLHLARRAAGTATVVFERRDVSWRPAARVAVAGRTAELIRQAVITCPSDLVLPAVPVRFEAAGLQRDLEGPALTARVVDAQSAPVSTHRSVRTVVRADGWGAAPAPAGAAALEESWELARLAIDGAAGEARVELDRGPLAIEADEWLLAPELASTLRRRLALRLERRPFLGGDLELVVDGLAAAAQELPAEPAGGLLQLCAGSDERIFVAATEPVQDDPDRPANRRRGGAARRVRNLSGETVRFACYLTRPVSEAAAISVALDGSTPGWAEPRPGVLRWDLELKPGEERVLTAAWVLEAAAGIRL